MSRRARVFVYLLATASLCRYGAVNNPAVTLPMCLAEPEKYDGTLLEIGAEITVREIFAGGFTIHQMGLVVPVSGDTTGLRVGDYVNLSAIFRAPAELELQAIYIAKGRRWKIVVSVLPVMVIGIVLMRKYRFDCRRFVFLER